MPLGSRMCLILEITLSMQLARFCLRYWWDIGTTGETAFERIHGCTPDGGANMLKGWEGIEGGGCVCHREATCLRHALALPEVNKLVNRIKGIANHFNRSDKVTCFCAAVG